MGDHGRGLVGPGDVGGAGRDVAAGVASTMRGGLGHGVGVEVDRDHRRALGGEALGGGASDPASGAR